MNMNGKDGMRFGNILFLTLAFALAFSEIIFAMNFEYSPALPTAIDRRTPTGFEVGFRCEGTDALPCPGIPSGFDGQIIWSLQPDIGTQSAVETTHLQNWQFENAQSYFYCHSYAWCAGADTIYMRARATDGTQSIDEPGPPHEISVIGPSNPDQPPRITLFSPPPLTYQQSGQVVVETTLLDADDDPALVLPHFDIYNEANNLIAHYYSKDDAAHMSIQQIGEVDYAQESRRVNVILSCDPSICNGVLTVEASAIDPLGMQSDPPPIRFQVLPQGGGADANPIITVLPQQINPGSTFIVSAVQKSPDPKIKSHNYRFEQNPPGAFLPIAVQKDAIAQQSSTDPIICTGCTAGSTLNIIVSAIAMDGTIAGTSTKQVIIGAAPPKQKLNLMAGYYPLAPDFESKITASAKTDMVADMQEYVWKDEGGAVLQDNKYAGVQTSSDEFDCKAKNCEIGKRIVLTVRAEKAGLDPEETEMKILINGKKEDTPIIGFEPKYPSYMNEIKAGAYQPGTRTGVLHTHTWTYANGAQTEKIPAGTQEIDALTRKTSSSLSCDSTKCPPGKAVSDFVSAYDAGGKLIGFSAAKIMVNSPKPAKPKLLSITPDDKYKNFEKLSQEPRIGSISSADSFELVFAPSDNGVAVDKYAFEIIKAGTIRASEESTDGKVSIFCQKAGGCAPYDVITLKTYALAIDGTRSDALILSFAVPFEYTTSGAVTVCKKGLLEIKGSPYTGDSLWVAYMGIGFAALFILIGLAYMLGSALHEPRLLEWAKTEIVQAVFAIVLFLLIVFLLDLMCDINVGEFQKWAGMTNAENTKLLEKSVYYLQGAIANTHATVIKIRTDMGSYDIRATRSEYVPTGLPGLGNNGYSYSPNSGDYTVIGTLNMLLNLNSTFLVSVLFVYYSLLIFATSSGLFILLVPIGFVMRSIPFMRHFGGALVAIGVGFYIFYPAFLGILSIVTGVSVSDAALTDIRDLVVQEQSLTGGPTTYLYDEPPLIAGGDTHQVLAVYFMATAHNFVVDIFLPSAGLVITALFIRDLSALLGEEVDASRIARMV